MKKLTIILFMLSSFLPLFAQDNTLIGEIKSVGFYFSPVLKLGRLNDNNMDAFRNDTTNVYYAGGQLGCIINHNLVVGIAGYSLAGKISGIGITMKDSLKYKFFYGGILLKYILNPHSLLHFSVHSLIGAGIFKYENTYLNSHEYSHRPPRGRHHVSSSNEPDYGRYKDVFYVFEPGVDLMLNLHKNLRVGVGITYRYIKDFDYNELVDSNLNGFTTQALIQIGNF